jgi:hypothetical protein
MTHIKILVDKLTILEVQKSKIVNQKSNKSL